MSQYEQERFAQVCSEHIWAAVGMHVLYQASGSTKEARSAALSVRELVKTAPAFRQCWDVVKPTIKTQGFHAFIAIVEQGLDCFDDDPTAEHEVVSRAPADTDRISGERVQTGDDTASMDRFAWNADSDPEARYPLGRLRVLSGKFAGRELKLTRAVTQLGPRGKRIVAIWRRSSGYFATSLDNSNAKNDVLVNETTIGSRAYALQDNDLLQIAGVQAKFVLS